MTDSTPTPTPAKKRSLGRLFLRLFLVLVILFVITLILLFLNANTLVKAGVVRAGMYATEQDTGLDAANISFVGGALTLDQLNIKNLKDYKEAMLVTMKKCETTLDSSTLFAGTVVVKEISIDGLELTVEQNGSKNNLNDLMAILQKNSPAAGDTSKTSPGKKLKIDMLRLTGTKVHLRFPPIISQDFDLGPIEMADPTNPDGRPMKIADLMSRILLNVAQQVMNDPRLPLDMKQNMKNVSAVVGNLKGQLDSGVKDLSKSLQGLSKDPMKAVQDLGKNGPDLGKNLQNLNPFGGKTTQPAK